jgi:3-oxoacyl-[acyl-carrier-protein] synthase II
MTGQAVLSGLADEADDLLDAFLSGRSGIGGLRHPDASHLRTTLAYQVADGDDLFLRGSAWVTALIQKAMQDAGISQTAGRRMAVVIGTSQREQGSVELWAAGRARAVTSDELSYRQAAIQALGPVHIVSLLGACAAGVLAVGIACDLLEDDQADVVVAVSVEPLQTTVLAMHDRMFPVLPTRIRPFDVVRNGTLFGEGAAAVVLERSEERDVPPRVTVRGVGFSSDGRRRTAPDPDGVLAAMQDAYARAEVVGEDIDIVFAHGTGTVHNEAVEAGALSRLNCTRAYVTALKPVTGHTLSSAGLISLIIAAACLVRGVVPPVLNLATKDPVAEQLNIPVEPVSDASLRFAQVDAFGFGGINAVAILERPG